MRPTGRTRVPLRVESFFRRPQQAGTVSRRASRERALGRPGRAGCEGRASHSAQGPTRPKPRPRRTEFPVNSSERSRRARGTGPSQERHALKCGLGPRLSTQALTQTAKALTPESHETSSPELLPAEKRRPNGPRSPKHVRRAAPLKRRLRRCSHPDSLAADPANEFASRGRGFQSTQETVSHRCRKR